MRLRRTISLLLCLCLFTPSVFAVKTDGGKAVPMGDYLRETISQGSLHQLAAAHAMGFMPLDPPAARDGASFARPLQSLLQDSNPHAEIPGLGATLAAAQQPDGSFGTLSEHISILSLLPHLLPAKLYDKAQAERFLAKHQNADGSFSQEGSEQSPLLLTAQAIRLLPEKSSRERAYHYIKEAAASAGSCTAAAALVSATIAMGQDVPASMMTALISFRTERDDYRETKDSLPDPALTLTALAAIWETVYGKSIYDALPTYYYADQDKAASPVSLLAVSRYGLLCGDGRGMFRPAGTVSRAEFAQVLYNIMDDSGDTAVFFDVPYNAWYAEAVGTVAAKSYLTEGLTTMNFSPEKPVTRLDVALSLTKLLSLDTDRALSALAKGQFSIPDWNTIPKAHQPAVAAVCYEGLLGAEDGFQPGGSLRRDALAGLLHSIYT